MPVDTLKISKKILMDQNSSKSPSIERGRLQRSIANSDSNPLLANDTGNSHQYKKLPIDSFETQESQTQLYNHPIHANPKVVKGRLKQSL